MTKISVVVPIYKKLEQFDQVLRHNLPLLKDAQIILVNDDPTTTFPRDFPQSSTLPPSIVWINNQSNLGFAPTVNNGVRQATGDLILLLNTDVTLLDQSWYQAVPHFAQDKSLFAISFAQRENTGKIVGRNELYFRRGLFHHRALPFEQNQKNAKQELLSTAWAEYGSANFRKSMWDTLNGLDERYAPFYWEDVDLSYRAKKKQWLVQFDPNILVKHNHESTTRSFYDQSDITKIAFRNQVYFTKKFASVWQLIHFSLFDVKRKLLG